MKVFISWSGERSQRVAELFKIWLKCVIQACDPWVSTEDIQRGSFWFNEVNNQLSEISIGIICLTNENKNRPWILFEAGALTKGLSTSRAMPFLVDLESKDLQPPLSLLNAAAADKKGLFSLTKSINLQLKEGALTSEVFSTVFETYWPMFDNQFREILATTPDSEIEDKRESKDILSEILLTVRGFDRRIRSLEYREGNVVSFSNFGQLHRKQYYNSTDFEVEVRNVFSKNSIIPEFANIDVMTTITMTELDLPPHDKHAVYNVVERIIKGQ